MFRTRDFILFILILFFLGTAITATLVSDDNEVVSSRIVSFNDAKFESGAVATDDTLDRQSILERLRTKLADSTERITPAASVEAPEVDEIVIAATGIQRCLYPDDTLSMVPRWPLVGVKIASKEGARLVYAEETVVIPAVSSGVASTTASEEVITTVIPLLQLPMIAQKQVETSCVPSEVVGVTVGGILMFNGDVNSYRKIPESVLIGYARDGFPVYGVNEGEVDECGGYDHPAGYRYTISTERDYIVGCYAGVPAQFSL